MPAEITCPNCGHEFEPNEAIREEVEKELRSKAAEWQKKKQEEFQQQLHKKEQEHQASLQTERVRLQQEVAETTRKTLTADYEFQLKNLEENNRDNIEKLRISRQKELEFLKKEQDLQNKEQELEITVQQKLQVEREKLSEELRKLEEQKSAGRENEHQLRVKELEKQLDDQKKLAEEMRRKAEQGSMQLQGEVQELALEEMLRANFPFDLITEVGKGIRGADCVQVVRNKTGQECGKIIYESKRTEAFGGDWIDKLKSDMRSLGAEVAVIVTKTMPREMTGFGDKDGVWICSFADLKGVAHMLREGIIRVSGALRNQVNSGEKMQLLYTYLTSGEFSEQWKAIREGFLSMRMSIQKERDQMEKLWKAREKQLDKVLLNAAHVRGSIEGIAGLESVDLNLLDAPNEDDQAH